MFSLFRDETMPVPAWILSHGPLLVLSTLALIAFAIMVRFAPRRDDGGFISFDSSSCDSGDSGDCGGD